MDATAVGDPVEGEQAMDFSLEFPALAAGSMWIVARPTKQDRQTAGEAVRAGGGGSYEGVMTAAQRRRGG
jgi:hypothetical protein